MFCQWDTLLSNVALAFQDFGIRFSRLHGSVYARTRTLQNFTGLPSPKQFSDALLPGAKSNVDVLLMSLEQSASGTNLTCANHVTLASRYSNSLSSLPSNHIYIDINIYSYKASSSAGPSPCAIAIPLCPWLPEDLGSSNERRDVGTIRGL